MLNVQEIPLSKLVASHANVRRTGRAEGIKQLAASIKAHGLLQNLTVRKGTGDTKGLFEVVAGGRRLAALQRLAKAKHIAKTAKIPCHVLSGESSEEISLAENVGQCPMHPADQYEAFAKLHVEQNMPAEDIAARFGISAAVVKQRLKLGSVSPRLIKRYRDGDMTLEQLTAFTITDDHKAQERVWRDLPDFNNDRSAILDALTEAHVPADDRRAVFVGAEAYEKAGGAVIRDLFDAESGGYLTDAALLNRLVREKLQRAAAKVMAEGWKWISVDPDFDHGAAAQMRRVHPHLGAEDDEKRKALLSRRTDLYDAEDDEQDVSAELETVEAEITALEERECFRPEDTARAGAFVCLDHDGHPRIERGYLRKEDEAPAPAESAEAEDGDGLSTPERGALSDKLVTELTAARTSALRQEIGLNPEVALTAILHALVLRLFYESGEGSCLLLTARQAALGMHAPALAEGADERAIAARHASWEKQFPDEPDALWEVIAAMKNREQLALLAHCTGLMVDAVHGAKTAAAQPADTLARAVGLDMTKHWQPTAASYFGRVSKDRIVEALQEAGGAEVPLPIFDMKKAAMADAAQAFMQGRNWLPAVLRTP